VSVLHSLMVVKPCLLGRGTDQHQGRRHPRTLPGILGLDSARKKGARSAYFSCFFSHPASMLAARFLPTLKNGKRLGATWMASPVFGLRPAYPLQLDAVRPCPGI